MKPVLNYKTGVVYKNDTYYISAVIQSLEENDVHHTAMLRWMGGRWDRWMIKKRIVSHIVCDSKVGRTIFSASIDGHVQVGDSNGLRWERVDKSIDGPNALRRIRCMALIGSDVYLAGMSRMVYKRSVNGGAWHQNDEGVRVPRSSREIAGFSAIGGVKGNDIYAVGMRGAIWHFDGGSWSKLESGTNVGLYGVLVLESGSVFVCGEAGVLLVGSGSQWRQVHNDATENCFWGISCLHGVVYLSTDQGEICKLENDQIVPVETGLEVDLTTFSLHSADGVMLSVGSKDIIVFDGIDWRKLEFF